MPDAYEILYGHPVDRPEPKEHAIYRRITDDFLNTFDYTGALLVRELAVIGTKHDMGEYLQYLFHTLDGGSNGWPGESKSVKNALDVARWIINYNLRMPNYRDGLTIPSGDKEQEVDAVLLELAKWCTTTLRLILVKDLLALTKKYAKDFAKVTEIPEGTDPATLLLIRYFRTVKKYPLLVRDGGPLWKVLWLMDLVSV